MYLEDTIAAISTPAGEGGIGVIRISGPDSLNIIENIYRRKTNGGLQSHRFYYGTIVVPESSVVLDEALVVYMRAPHSFTREDVVEIQCHSGTVIIQQILQQVLRAGARLAEPGEFTKRAFLNGRIDLVQAEAVIDLIRAKTDAAVTVARQQVSGALSQALFQVREHIRYALAIIEAYVDFPEEDLVSADNAILFDRINAARTLIGELLCSYDQGKVIREGVSVLIIGKPNVGKSSILNALLMEKRAIVTSVPGTTRDIIEEVVNINGLPVKLLDTAGIRDTDDPVEREGVNIAKQKISAADIVLLVLDASSPFDADDQAVVDCLGGSNFLLVLNKMDLDRCLIIPQVLRSVPNVSVATTSPDGIDPLRNFLSELFLQGRITDSRAAHMLSRERHRDVLQRVDGFLSDFIGHCDASLASELLAVDLRDALDSLGQVTGETTPDDILDLVFQQFCIGK